MDPYITAAAVYFSAVTAQSVSKHMCMRLMHGHILAALNALSFIPVFLGIIYDTFDEPEKCRNIPIPNPCLTQLESNKLKPKLISKHGNSISHSGFNYSNNRISGLSFSKALT